MMISAGGLRKNFGELRVLDGISFGVEKGCSTAIIGPSGSGKSTLLRCLIDLERVDGGDIVIAGEPLCVAGKYPKDDKVSAICGKMGMVFQQFNLFPHMTVRQNLLCAPKLKKQARIDELNDRCRRLLSKVGLEDKIDAKPHSLSGGQRQRAAIARALMQDPEIMLFDEPTSALDPELTHEVMETIKALVADRMTILIVTHEISFARQAAARVIFMDGGTIVEEGPPDEVLDNPRNERTIAFLNKVK
jgi:polar amino acid transport system ATP-binding protein